MALSTYTELQAAIKLWLNRNDLADAIPDFVRLCEADLDRRLRTRENETMDTAFAVSSRYTTLPTTFVEMRRAVISATPRVELEPVSPVISAAQYTTGKPRYYAVVGNQFELMPIPDGSYTLEITYWRTVPRLADNATTDVLTRYPDVYLFGSCMQAGYFQDDPGLVARFQPFYEKALADANGQKHLGSGLMIRAA